MENEIAGAAPQKCDVARAGVSLTRPERDFLNLLADPFRDDEKFLRAAQALQFSSDHLAYLEEWIMNKLHRELETRLRTDSGVHDILLAIEVEPYEKTEAVPYMPSEKAKYMMEKSPEVRNLCDDLGLDLK